MKTLSRLPDNNDKEKVSILPYYKTERKQDRPLSDVEELF